MHRKVLAFVGLVMVLIELVRVPELQPLISIGVGFIWLGLYDD